MGDEITPALIAEIYEAATVEDGLVRLVDIVRRVVDVDNAGIWLRSGTEIRELTVSDSIAASVGPYLAYYCQIDPWSAVAKMRDRVTLGSEIYSEDKLLKGEFYTDFARHFEMTRPMGVSFDIATNTTVMISTNRGSPGRLLDDLDKARFSDLVAHLKGALTLRHRLGIERSAQGALATAFERLAFAAIVCTPEGEVLFANDAARTLEAERAIRLNGSQGGLSAMTAEKTNGLRRLIAAAATRGEAGSLALGTDGLVLALVTPLPGARPELNQGRALVTLRRADAVAGPSLELLRQLFDLTPAQAHLCVQLARGLTFEAAAAERGVALSTARTHFSTILRKTGTDNLRDLLRLLGSMPQINHM
ncbi:hypothetical protein DK419_00645 [Methylobacterium terrae]|uniref:HTH luxR-type domain-containing protein n=1 Tax=Methylobacterium terrae TaxID=2202827 RepID=A0A2U8WHY6_9HYPH|nr:hypothetical protein DK419_00645 [Methylobacterium terrae]